MDTAVMAVRRWLAGTLLVSLLGLTLAATAAQPRKALHLDDQAAAARAVAALSVADANARADAVRLLGTRGDDTVLPELQHGLVDLEPRVRAAAIEALAEVGSAAALATLAMALADEHAALRQDAVYAVGRIGGEGSREIAEQALGDPDEAVREAAAQVIEELRVAAVRASEPQNSNRRPAVPSRGKSRSVKPTASPVR